ncbi:MAG: (Fe-S)-binding protein [Polyangiaceae bacterium]|nr:(Fe-S)-binding protein [Polyangiaceae bacterium]
MTLLEAHREELEKCVYCPKLCRAACPVSNVEASEAVTPWGKMSMAYFSARGDVPIDEAHAVTAWACSGCHACRERCDHGNEVAAVLGDARAELFARGAAPAGARDVAARFWERAEELRREVEALEGARAEAGGAMRAGAQGEPVAVLIGCGYVRHAPEVAREALDAVEAIVGAPARPLRSCCGLPLLHAGDRRGFEEAARRLAAEVASVIGGGAAGRGGHDRAGRGRFVAVDPGCARAVLVEYPRVGVQAPAPELFVDLARAAVDRLSRSTSERRVRVHDPCQLGRGLGRYDAPRAILARISGRPPEEFIHRRELADCSGAGGLLPATRPVTSAGIADQRIEEHRALGGGLLVTHCAQSLRRFRSCGEPAEDLVSLVARAVAPR